PAKPSEDPYKHSQNNCEDEEYVHLCVCFQQCVSDQATILGDDCGETTSCSSSSIQERYKLILKDGKAPEINLECGVPDFILNGRVNYYALVESVHTP